MSNEKEKEPRIIDYIPENLRAQLKKEVLEEIEQEKKQKADFEEELKKIMERI